MFIFTFLKQDMIMVMNDILDKAAGCIVGGAVGDALGYPVEFIGSFKAIAKRFGEGGIKDYVLSDFGASTNGPETGVALISDDTQMTLYTMEGILEAEKHDSALIPTVLDAYIAWYAGQSHEAVKLNYESKLASIDELNQNRAPGTTCMSALEYLSKGLNPINYSKGCGGVMRVSPIGIYGALKELPLEETGRLAGEAAFLTHKHEMSTYSSAMLAVMIQMCLLESVDDKSSLKNIINHALEIVENIYGTESDHLSKFKKVIHETMEWENGEEADWTIIEKELGEGWIAEEALSIALFSVLRHFESIEECLICAVNHGGDSDSTGAVAGNIMGAIKGYEAIPEKFKQNLQFHDLLLTQTNTFCETLHK